MTIKKYVSDKLLASIIENKDKVAGVGELYRDANKLNCYYVNQDWEACHITIRTIIEYTKSIYKVNELSDIINSYLWKKTKDSERYQAILSNLDIKNQDFFKSSDEHQKTIIELIDNARIFPNNYLHKGLNRHYLIIDEYTLPERYQINLLVNICLIGLFNSAEQVVSSESSNLFWCNGLGKIDEKQEINLDIGLRFFEDAFLLTSNLSHEQLEIESVHLAILMCRGEFKLAKKYINSLLSKSHKKVDLNRWGQLKLALGYLTFVMGKKKEGIYHLIDVFEYLKVDYPYIAKEAAYILRSTGDIDEYIKWSDAIELLSDAKSISDTTFDKYAEVINKIYEIVINSETGVISYSFSREPSVLDYSYSTLANNIMNACSCGRLSSLSTYLKEFIQIKLIDLYLNKNYQESAGLVLSLIKVITKYIYFDEKILSNILELYSTHYLYDSLPDFFIDIFDNIDSLPVLLFLEKNLLLLSEPQLDKLFNIANSKLKKKEFKSNKELIVMKDAYLSLFFNMLSKSEGLFGEHYFTFIDSFENYFSILKNTSVSSGFNSLNYFLMSVFNKNIDNRIQKKISHNVLELIDKSSVRHKFYCYYFMLFNGDTNILINKHGYSLIELWVIATYHPKEIKIIISMESLLEYLSSELNRLTVAKKRSTRDDDLFNDFLRISYSLCLHACEEDYSKVVAFVFQLISKKPKQVIFMHGEDHESFLGSLYLLLTSDIPIQIKESLFEKIKSSLDNLKEIKPKKNLTDFSRGYEIIEDYFYKIIYALIYKKSLLDKELYSLLFSLEFDPIFSYMPSSFHMLSRQLTEGQQIFLCHFLLDIFVKNQVDLLTKQIIARVYRKISLENKIFFDEFEQKKHIIPAKIQRIILGKY